MESDRRKYIDVARGLGMLMIMWGHIMLAGPTNAFVYSFHIPAFFFLSGAVFDQSRYKSFRAFFLRRIRTLMVPYFIFSFATYAWWVLDNYISGTQIPRRAVLLEIFLARGSGGFLVHNVALWFVPCLFVVGMIYFFAAKIKNPFARAALCAGISAGGYLLTRVWRGASLMPWSIEVALEAMIFYGAGNILKDVKIKYDWAICPAALGLTVLGALKNGRVSMAQGYLGNNVLVFYLTAFCGITFLISASRLISGFKLSGLTFIGKYSFDMMGVHIPIMLLTVRLLSSLFGVPAEDVRVTWYMALPGLIIMTAASVTVSGWIEKLKSLLKRSRFLDKTPHKL